MGEAGPQSASPIQGIPGNNAESCLYEPMRGLCENQEIGDYVFSRRPDPGSPCLQSA